MNTDRALGCLVGGLVGLLLSCCCLAVPLALGQVSNATGSTAVPEGATLEVTLSEAYLSRTMLNNAASFPSPVPLTAGQMDVQPGNRADFSVQADVSGMPLVFDGTVALNAVNNQLAIEIVALRVGYLPVTPLLPLVRPDLEQDLNNLANSLLTSRTAAAGVQLIGISSDDDTLRFHLIAVP